MAENHLDAKKPDIASVQNEVVPPEDMTQQERGVSSSANDPIDRIREDLRRDKVNLWLCFLKQAGVDLVCGEQNLIMEWMECCNGKREEIERGDFTPQQKKRAMDMADENEDAAIAEIERMTEELMSMVKSKFQA